VRSAYTVPAGCYHKLTSSSNSAIQWASIRSQLRYRYRVIKPRIALIRSVSRQKNLWFPSSCNGGHAETVRGISAISWQHAPVGEHADEK